jgi:hypothetical protein
MDMNLVKAAAVGGTVLYVRKPSKGSFMLAVLAASLAYALFKGSDANTTVTKTAELVGEVVL